MKRQYAFIAAALLVLCAGCGGKEAVAEPVQDTAQESSLSEETPEPETTTEPERESETEEAEEIPFEEDTNVYGNSMGNLNNEGFFVKCDENGYVERNVFGQTYLIDHEGNGTYIRGTNIYSLNYCDGKIYAIWDDADQERNKSILTGNMEDETFHIDTERKAENLYVVNGIVYYKDAYTHKLYCYDPEEESGEDTLLVDSAVYYPVFYKDRIIFQMDEDGESLYSISLDGGESTKLNDVHSHWPIVYKDKIYYQGIINAAYTLRSMNLDGTDDQEIAKIRYRYPVLCGDKLCVIDESKKGAISYLELEDLETGFQVAEVGGELIKKYDADENAFSHIADITQYEIREIDHVAAIDDKLLFWAYFRNDGNDWLVDAAEYDFSTAQAEPVPFFDARKIEGGEAMAAADLDMSAQEPAPQPVQETSSQQPQEPDQQPVQEASAQQSKDAAGQPLQTVVSSSSNHNYYKNCTQEQADQADAIAKQIADTVMGNPAYTTDLQKVDAAAQLVKSYCDKGVYGADENKYYRSPYGVFVSGNWTCAGGTRAMGRVLDFMGYEWTHVNENQWAHQWCILTLDGQIGFAEGVCGCAKYGDWNTYFWTDGMVVYHK